MYQSIDDLGLYPEEHTSDESGLFNPVAADPPAFMSTGTGVVCANLQGFQFEGYVGFKYIKKLSPIAHLHDCYAGCHTTTFGAVITNAIVDSCRRYL